MDTFMSLFFDEQINYKEILRHSINVYKKRLNKGISNSKSRSVLESLKKFNLGNLNSMNYSEFIRFSNRNRLLFLYSQLEEYLFKSFHYISERRLENLKKYIKKTRLRKFFTRNNIDKEIDQGNIERYIQRIAAQHYHNLIQNTQNYFDFYFDIPYGGLSLVIKELGKYKNLRNKFAHGNGFISKPYPHNLIITNKQLDEYHQVLIEFINAFDKAFINKFSNVVQDNDDIMYEIITDSQYNNIP
jgi:hypothetical protein